MIDEGTRPYGLAGGLLLAALVATGLVFEGFNNQFGNALVCIAWSLLLAGLLVARPVPLRLWGAAWPVLLPVALALGWAGLCLVRSGPLAIGAEPLAPDLAMSELLGSWGYVAALLCGLLLGFHRVPLGRMLGWLLLFGCLSILLGLAVREGAASGAWQLWDEARDGRFLGTLGNANAAAAAYGALAMLALARALHPERRSAAARALAWGALMLALSACLLTASRSGAVLVGLGLVLVTGASVSGGLRRWPAIAVGLAVIVYLVVSWNADLLVARIEGLGDSADVRFLMWQHFWDAAMASPWFGYGPGAFSEVNRHVTTDIRIAQAVWTVNSPHNFVIGLVLHAGLPLLLLLGCAAGAMLVAVVRAGRFDLHETALVAAILVILGLATVDIALDVPALVVLALAFAGLLWGRALAKREVGVARA